MPPSEVRDVTLILFGIWMCVNLHLWLHPGRDVSDAFRVAGTTSPRFGLNTDCSP